MRGIRVVDITVYIAGPTAGMVLGDWGADVIKLEPLAGDPQRQELFSWGTSPAYNYWWEWANRNKRGVAVDLTHPRGKEIAYRLIEKADIFVSNLRAKALDRLGLDYKTLSRLNPRLVYAHSTGYGPRGPDSHKASYDSLATWTRSGLAAAHMLPQCPPAKEHATLGDTPTGFFLAAGAVLGLMNRLHTGKGTEVNTSLLATGLWMNSWALLLYIASGAILREDDRSRSRNPLYNYYPTRDGWLEISLYRQGEWEELCRALDREDLRADPRFNSEQQRCQNNVLLISLLDEVFQSRTTEEWKAHLNHYDLAWEAIQEVDKVVGDPQVVANDYLIEVDNPKIGRLKQIASPVQFHKTPFKPQRPAPELGQHTAEVLREIGYSQKEVEELKTAGVIASKQRAAITRKRP